MIENEIKEMKESKQGRSAKIFKIAEKIRGPKKGFSEPQAIKDPFSGKLVVSSEEIKKVCLDHCVKTLQDNPVEKGFEEEIKLKEFLHELRMTEGLEEESKVDKETFNAVLEKFKRNNKRNYDFIVKAGKKFY